MVLLLKTMARDAGECQKALAAATVAGCSRRRLPVFEPSSGYGDAVCAHACDVG
jgi:hypothetical protein